jgi:hypothetical protein
MNDDVSDARGFWLLLTSPKLFVSEAHYVVIPAYIYVKRVARGPNWITGRYSGGERVRIRWGCGWGRVHFMAFISVVPVHIEKSVEHFGVFIPQ